MLKVVEVEEATTGFEVHPGKRIECLGGKCSFRVTKVQELWNLVTPAHRDALLLGHESPGGDVAVVVKVRHHNTEPQMRIMLSLSFSLYVFDKVGHHNNALECMPIGNGNTPTCLQDPRSVLWL